VIRGLKLHHWRRGYLGGSDLVPRSDGSGAMDQFLKQNPNLPNREELLKDFQWLLKSKKVSRAGEQILGDLNTQSIGHGSVDCVARDDRRPEAACRPTCSSRTHIAGGARTYWAAIGRS
jgi:hypothetical protein